MSVESLTINEFLQLSLTEHEDALELFDKAIFLAAQGLVDPEQDSGAFADERDKLTRLITLRKVHQGRYAELYHETAQGHLAKKAPVATAA